MNDLGEIFGLSKEGVDPFTYKNDEYLESFRLTTRSSCQNITRNLKRPMLRKKYRLLVLILTKCIFGEQQSHDRLTKTRICCLRVIIDEVQVN